MNTAIRAIPSAWFKPNARIYWTDMLASAFVGWTAFAFAVAAPPLERTALLILAAFALYRAVLFIHELTHLAPHELPAFRMIWNAVVGLPLLLPSFLYEGVHTDHHRQRCYGTPGDPEYLPFAWRPLHVLIAYAIASVIVPVGLVIRFGVLAPLSWLVPPVERITRERFSALIVNHHYVRHAPVDSSGRVQEALAACVVWGAMALWLTGVMTATVFFCWLIVTTFAATINVVRTLASHRYDHDILPDASGATPSLSMTEQLLDSCTIRPGSGIAGRLAIGWRELWAPVGLRYHALHHWIPSLPYHNLARAHRLLLSTLSVDARYGSTEYNGLAPLLIDLVHRARTNTGGTS